MCADEEEPRPQETAVTRPRLFIRLFILKKTGSKHADITVSQDREGGGR